MYIYIYYIIYIYIYHLCLRVYSCFWCHAPWCTHRFPVSALVTTTTAKFSASEVSRDAKSPVGRWAALSFISFSACWRLSPRLPWRNLRLNQWIGLRENLNRKPWFWPSNWSGFPVNFPIIQFYDWRKWKGETTWNNQIDGLFACFLFAWHGKELEGLWLGPFKTWKSSFCRNFWNMFASKLTPGYRAMPSQDGNHKCLHMSDMSSWYPLVI